MTYISTQSLSTPLRQSVMQLQAQLTTAQQEVSTGQYADLGLQLGGQTGQTLSLGQASNQLQTLTNTNQIATTRLSSTSSALDSIMATAQSFSNTLLSTGATATIPKTMQEAASSGLQSLISALNTSVSGQYIFSGTNTAAQTIGNYTDTPPSASKTAVDTAFSTAFGMSQTDSNVSSISGSAMQSFLNGNFSALFTGSNWSSNWSSASSQTQTSQISPSQQIATSVSANQTALQDLAQAYTMVTELGGQNFGADASQAVITTATKLVNQAISGLTDLQAGVGIAQSNITEANSQMSAQKSLLQTNIGSLENVDSYSLSTTISQLQTQIESSYQLTASLKSLSLVTYLPAG